MASARLFFLVYVSFYLVIKADGCQQFSLTSSSMGTYSCPGSNITYTCVLNSSSMSVATAWTGSALQCPSNQIGLSQTLLGVLQPSNRFFCGSLSAVTTNVTSTCYTSVLTIPANQTLNGTTVVCKDGNTGTIVGDDTLKITSSPEAPDVIMMNTIGPNMVQVVVNPSSSGGLPTSYNVTISNSSYVYYEITPAFSNGSAMIIFTGAGLTNNTNYTISSVAINCAGSSNSSDLTTILVSWLAPPPSPPPTSSPSIPTTTPTPTVTSGNTTSDDSNIGVIIGASVGGVGVVFIVIAIILLCCLCKTCPSKDENDDDDDDQQKKKVDGNNNLELQKSNGERGNVEPVPPRDRNAAARGRVVPEEEALYNGPGDNVPTGGSGHVDDAQYSTVDTTKKNTENTTTYAAVQVGPASAKAPASGKARGRALPPTSADHQGVLYSSVATPSR